MSGDSPCVLQGGAVLLALTLVTGSSLGAAVKLDGRVRVNGAVPGSAVCIDVLHRGQSLGLVETDKDGRFAVFVKVPAGVTNDTGITLVPYNEKALRTDWPTFLSGFLRVPLTKTGALELALSTESIADGCVQVVDERGQPVPSVPIECSARVPLSAAPGATVNYEGRWLVAADKEGQVKARVVKVERGEYTFTLNAQGFDGNRYVGKLVLPAKQLLESHANPLQWRVTSKRLALLLQCNWDPDFSKEPFRPNVGGDVHSHALVLNDDATTGTMMSGDGTVRWYDLKPGRYSISFKKGISPLYTISRSTGVVEIPDAAAAPVKHVITLLPAKQWELSGAVRDSKNGNGVVGAIIMCGLAMAKSGQEGAFTIQVPPSVDSMTVEHQDYRPGRFALPQEGMARQLTVSIMPYPAMSGKVMVGDKECAFAKLRFMGTVSDRTTTCGGDGGFAFRLKPGEYQLAITAPVLPGDGRPQREPLPTVRLFDGKFTMAESDTEQTFRLPPIAKVLIEADWNVARLAGVSPSIVCLLRKADGKIMASAQLGKDKMAAMYVPAGDYSVLAVGNEQRGNLCGLVQADGSQQVTKRIEIQSWRPMRVGKMGIPEFVDER